MTQLSTDSKNETNNNLNLDIADLENLLIVSKRKNNQTKIQKCLNELLDQKATKVNTIQNDYRPEKILPANVTTKISENDVDKGKSPNDLLTTET